MTSWMPPTHDTHPLPLWSAGPRLVRQNAFAVDPTEPYTPFDYINSPRSDDSFSVSSFSSSSVSGSVEDNTTNDIQNEVDISNIENDIGVSDHGYVAFHRYGQRRQPLGLLFQRQTPLPENTGDYDGPLPTERTTSDHDLQSATLSRFGIWSGILGLRSILYCIFSVIVYEIYACSELQPIPPERLYTVDPTAPSHVWVPVFYWSCWKRVWFVEYKATVALAVVTIVVLYWLFLKRR